MADPLSIASGALAVLTATQATVSVVYKFTRDCKDARADLTRLTGELSELTLVLELIRNDNAAASEDCLPSALQAQVQAMLTSCTATVQQIQTTLTKCRGRSGPLRWTILEKDKVTALKSSLEAFKSGLSLALETVNLSITREINNRTEIILDSTVDIKRDTSELLAEIHKLRSQLPTTHPSDEERRHLEQWLDSLTHYAETVVDSEERGELSDAASSLTGIKEQEPAGETRNSYDIEEEEAPAYHHITYQLPAYITPDAEPTDTSDAEVSVRRPDTSSSIGTDRIENKIGGASGSNSSSRFDLGAHNQLIEEQVQDERRSREISSHTASPVPCSSRAVVSTYCLKTGIRATLYEDYVLRFSSSHSVGSIEPLLVLRKMFNDQNKKGMRLDTNNTRLSFCPDKPEVVLIEVSRYLIEVWNWNESRRVRTAPDLQKAYRNEYTIGWMNFMPDSTIIYQANRDGNMIIVDLQTPLLVQKISLQTIGGRAQGGIIAHQTPAFEEVLFISDHEIWILWDTMFTQTHSFWGAKLSRWSAKIIQLPLTPNNGTHQRAPISMGYNNTTIKKAHVKAEYRLPRDIRCGCIFDIRVKPITRTLEFEAEHVRVGSEGNRKPRMKYTLNLDTGKILSRTPCTQGPYSSFRPINA